jgi:hypothetical protein
MTTKLAVYNDALLAMGERRLNSLSDRSPSRFELDETYDQSVQIALERGYWNFAMRSVMLDPSASITPSFGYRCAFEKPSDWVQTYAFSASESFVQPLLDIVDENNLWYANCDPLYLKYVSSDSAYGGDLSLWPSSFASFVAHEMAIRACHRITGAAASDRMLLAHERARGNALSRDAMNEPPGFPPTGTWVQSRGGHSSSMRSRWNGQSI